MEAQDLAEGTALVPGRKVKDVVRVVLDEKIPVYDIRLIGLSSSE